MGCRLAMQLAALLVVLSPVVECADRSLFELEEMPPIKQRESVTKDFRSRIPNNKPDEEAVLRSRLMRQRNKTHPGDTSSYFDHLDANDDGKIVHEELQAVMAAKIRATPPGSSTGQRNKKFQSIIMRQWATDSMGLVDKDQDGMITKDEFIAHMHPEL